MTHLDEAADLQRRFGGLERLYGVEGAGRIRRAHVAVVGIGGLLVGLASGWLLASLQRRLVDPAVEITVSMLAPFGVYIAAQGVQVSGVLATVAAGLCAGWWAPNLTPETRLRSRAVWDTGSFLLNGLVFILIGLQLLRIVPALATRPPDPETHWPLAQSQLLAAVAPG